MITKFGENLHILFIPKIGEDWQSFASWYSVNKNLPHAKTSLCFTRQKDVTPFQIFQWARRLEMPVFGISDRKNDLLNMLTALFQVLKTEETRVLILPSLYMSLKPLTEDILDIFNDKEERLIWNPDGVAFSSLSLKKLLADCDEYMLSNKIISQGNDLVVEAKEADELYSLVSYRKGCGKWIHKRKGCPFSSAGGLVEEVMTINEQKIIDLWRKMVPLYNSIN